MRLHRLMRRPLALWAAAFLAIAMGAIPFLDPTSPGGAVRSAYADDPQCAVPVDISMVFDRSGSMASPASKMTNAKAAATGFVDAFAGGPSDPDLSPHQIAAVSFATTYTTDQSLTTNANALRTAISGYVASGSTSLGNGLWLGQAQLQPPNDMDAPPDTNDYLVLLSDGSANQPQNVTSSGANNDLYLDVNNNGMIDSGDDLSVDFPGGDSAPTSSSSTASGRCRATRRS